jgi:hypothetical protein
VTGIGAGNAQLLQYACHHCTCTSFLRKSCPPQLCYAMFQMCMLPVHDNQQWIMDLSCSAPSQHALHNLSVQVPLARMHESTKIMPGVLMLELCVCIIANCTNGTRNKSKFVLQAVCPTLGVLFCAKHSWAIQVLGSFVRCWLLLVRFL